MVQVSGWRGQKFGGLSTEIKEEFCMSTALWCDAGNHAFSSNDPEKRHFTQETQVAGHRDNLGNGYDYRTVTVGYDTCGKCWGKQNPFQQPDSQPAPKEPMAALTAAEADLLVAERDQYKAQAEANAHRPRPTTAYVVKGPHDFESVHDYTVTNAEPVDPSDLRSDGEWPK
jgi:hypothetical protein